MATEKKRCTCDHDYQDAKYGQGMRVFNLGMKTKGSGTKATCTVCGKER